MKSMGLFATSCILLLLYGCGISGASANFNEPGNDSGNGGNNNNPNPGGSALPSNPLVFANPLQANLLGLNSPSPTRLAALPLSANSVLATVRGYRNGLNQGQVVALPANGQPGAAVPILANGVGNVSSLTDPFSLARFNSADLLLTDQVTGNSGRLIAVTGINTVTGLATHNLLGTATLRNPIDVATSGNSQGIWVCEYRASNDGGAIRQFNPNTNNLDLFADGLSFPSSLVFVNDSGRSLLYVAENGSNAVSGSAGGVLRIDLATFTPGSTITNATPGVTVVTPQSGDPAYSHPFDLAGDTGFSSGNLIVTEGLTMDLSTGILTVNGTGRVRAIPSLGRTNPNNSRLIFSNLVAPRGPWMTILSDPNEMYMTVADGLGTSCNVRSLGFHFSTGLVNSNVAVLASGRSDVLDTAVNPSIPSFQFTANTNGSGNGQVIDVR